VSDAPVDEPVRLSRHMALAIIAPVVMLVVMGAALAWQVAQMTDSARLVTHTNLVIAKFAELRVRIADKESALRGYLLSGDASHRETYDATVPRAPLEELRTLTADNASQQTRLNEIQVVFAQWETEASTAIAARSRDDVEGLTRRRTYARAIRAQITDAVNEERGLLAQRQRDNENTDRNAKYWFLGLLGLAAATIAFVSRRQLAVISKAFAAKVSSERAAKNASREQEWIQRGEATVSAAVLGERSLEEVAQRSLDVLCVHTGAPIGAVYILRGGMLERVAGRSVGATTPSRVSAEEGVIGSVSSSGQLAWIDDATAQLAVTGGLGERTTIQLAIVPAKLGERVVGVLELGFLERPRAATTELFTRVSLPIGIAIHTALQRARLQELLEETQRQGEELQTQHEELRVTNEELEQQGQALREAHARQQNIQHELEAANANLEEQTATLEQQREELLRAQADLEHHAAELQRTNQYKSEFLARMSHELRTPLNSTLILARLLGDNVGGNLSEEQVRFANTIYSAGNDLLVLINDILDLAKIEAGRLELRLGQVSLERIRDTLLREFEPVAKSRGLAFTFEIAPGVPSHVTTDEQRVVQVLRNLVSNACKFTERGTVRVVASSGSDRIELAVTDSGIGIPEDQREAVFEAFHQIDGSVSRRHGGTGLGLAISRDLAHLLGGKLRLASTLGKGSTFSFDIPLEPPVAKPRAATPDVPVVRLPAPTTQRVQRVTPPPMQAVTSAPSHDDRDRLVAGKRTLLVIEDDAKFASVLRDLARELGYQVLHAITADEGVELAMRHRPDGILLDVQLPDHSGLSVLERIKRQPAIRHVPIHMLSVEDHTRRSLELGAVGYLLKPANRDELVGAIRRIEDRTSHHVRRVLVVEDDPVQSDALRQLLKGTSAEIVATPTVKEALAQLAGTTFDCVVMDLRLADGTGFELLEKMAADDRITFPPVIIYTGKALTEAEEDRLRQYSSSIIVKGARSPERLLDEVTLFLHQVEADLPQDRQRQLVEVRNREALFEGKTVLVVEDDVRNVFALSSVLEPRGLRTVIARNGREALEALAKGGIDLVLMDVMMPEMNGIDATKAIRANPAWKELPVIALTAKAMADDRQACLDAGASDYLSKPIDVDMLLSLLRVWMPR
jgi:CheY-like chemotaxis protein/CHASE3 domain sensor protein